MLLPPSMNDYAGPRFVVWFLIVYNVIGTVRSLIHMFVPDSGAHSIATMNLNVTGSQNIIALLGQWGGAQLIMAIIIWIVLWRYQAFVPLMIAEILLEQLIRLLIGRMKPIATIKTAPGKYGTFILLPISMFLFLISLWKLN